MIKRLISLENYFLLAIFLLPVYLLRFPIFGLPTNLWETLAVIAIVLALWKEYKNLIFNGYDKKIIILFSIIILGLMLGMIKSGNYRTGLGIIKGWFIIPFAFSLLASKIIKDKKGAYLSLFFSVFIVATIALVYKITGAVTYDGRLQAFYNSPNYLAMLLAPAIIIAVVIQNSKIKNQNLNSKLKILSLFSFLAILVSLYFTYSYAAWISMAVTLIMIFLLAGKLSKKYFLIIFLIFLALLLILKDSKKFNDLVNYDSRSSLASREMIWQSSGKMLSDNYILGIGPGNFQEKYLEYQKYFPPYLQWAVPHPHNIILAFWLSAGLIGLLAFLTILYLFFTNKTPGSGVSTGMKYISFGIVIYFFLHGLVDTTILKNDLAVVFWLAILL